MRTTIKFLAELQMSFLGNGCVPIAGGEGQEKNEADSTLAESQ